MTYELKLDQARKLERQAQIRSVQEVVPSEEDAMMGSSRGRDEEGMRRSAQPAAERRR